MFPPEAWRQIARNLGFSGRELQIVRATFDDQTESAMATDLRISASTIHTHIERLHRKLSIRDRPQLLLRVVQEFMTLTVSAQDQGPLICSGRTRRCCPLRPGR
jgi:DNA-binding NarL/FixJ family response regulator